MTQPKSPREQLVEEYGLSVDHTEYAVLIYDRVLGTTIGMPISMAEILLDELRYHVATARLESLGDPES